MRSQSSKFVISLQYLKKEVSDEADDLLHADDHESFLQVDAMNFDGNGQVDGNKAKRRILKRVFQENKARQIFR